MNGLAQYVNFNPCPYPEIVDAFNSIPQSDIPQPIMQDSPCCCQQGLGDFQMTAPDGYFSSGLDFTQWGLGEWLTIVLGGYMVFSTLWTTNSAVRYAKEGVKRRASRKKKIATAEKSRGFF